MVKISVVIPTYNCMDVLCRCLDSLAVRDGCGKYEVIVVDDGSTDGTVALLRKRAEHFPGELRFFDQEHRGPATARNLGVRNSSGSTVLFLGADMLADGALLREHLDSHERNPEDNVAVLGHIAWAPGIRITPFLRWLEHGAQFGYPLIRDDTDVPCRFFYSSNLSVKREFLLKYGLFDEDFPNAAFEDFELGYRLSKAGLRIMYNPHAVAYHDHRIDQKGFAGRSRRAGEALRIVHRKHPELAAEYRPPDTHFLKRAIALSVWHIPQGAAGLLPEAFLSACYLYMVARFMHSGYSGEGRGTGGGTSGQPGD
jgi:GT2 family glycosyltransferase